MSKRYLITSMEVIASSPVGHNYDTRLLCQFLPEAEYKLISDCCFGEEFYLALIEDMKDIEEYDDCKDYSLGDIVVFGARIYEAIGEPQAGESPETDPSLWSITPKFNNPDYEELYECYLRDLLAFCVLHSSIISQAIRVETIGVMKNNTNYSESAEDKTILLLKSDIQNRIETRRSLMDSFLRRVSTTYGINNPERYPLYPANKEYLCNTGCNTERYKDSVNIPFLGCGGKKKKCDN